jgi:hypothetical protein
MTTKIISGSYAFGYALSSSFSEVEVTASGSIGGFGLLTNNGAFVADYGRIVAASGANGVSMTKGGSLLDHAGAAIVGGLGVAAPAGGSQGSAGGAGVAFYAPGAVANYSVMAGGQGGYGGIGSTYGGLGGTGGSGIEFRTGGSMANAGVVEGGQGGHGGHGAYSAAYGGDGGAGVTLVKGGSVINQSGSIYGGRGGTGGFGYGGTGSGGNGGAGVTLVRGGGVANSIGLIEGGLGGAPTTRDKRFGADGGYGGTGVYLEAGGNLVNKGTVEGGAGRAGAYGYYDGGNGGVGGYGVVMLAGGKVTNTGTIKGGAGGAGGTAGIHGTPGSGDFQGVGVSMLAGGSLTNGSRTDKSANIDGSYGVLARGLGHATVTNFGTIGGEASGWAVQFRSASDVLVVEAGCAFNGGVTGALGTLDLADGTGSFTGLTSAGNVTVSGSMATTTFQNFGTVEIGASAHFTLTGAGTVAAGQGMIDAGILNVTSLDVAGSLTLSHELLGVGRRGLGTLTLNGGTAAFDAGALLLLPHVAVTGASKIAVDTNLSYAGQWLQSAGTVTVASGDTLTFTGGGNQFAGTLAGPGTVAFVGGSDTLLGTSLTAVAVTIAGAAVTLSGAITTAGVMTIASPSLTVAAAGATLAGAGVTLTDSAANRIVGATSSAALTIEDHLYGAGQLGGGAMMLTNAAGGLIEGDGVNALIVDTGTNTVVNAGTIAAISAGGVTVQSAVDNTGLLFAEGGNLTVNGAVTGAGAAEVDVATLSFASSFAENVAFTGTTGVLELAQSQGYTGNISGFSKTGGTFLDLGDIGFVGAGEASFSGSATSGVLTVTDGTHTAKIALIGDYLGSTFTASSDGHGGTTIVDPTKSPGARVSSASSAPSLHQFVAAMAGLSGSAAGAVHVREVGPLHEPLLAYPRAMTA